MKIKRRKFNQSINEQEEQTVSAVSNWQEINASLTDVEFEALAICVGERPPNETQTREWAWKKLKPLMQGKLSALMLSHILAAQKLQETDPKTWEFVMPKEKQVLETTGPDGGPQEVSVTHKVEDFQFEATMQAYRAIKQQEAEQDEPIDA